MKISTWIVLVLCCLAACEKTPDSIPQIKNTMETAPILQLNNDESELVVIH